MSDKKAATIYYDGLCVVCSKEMDHYKKMRGAQKIDFVDITSPHFDCGKAGLDPVRVNRFLHVRTSDGVIHVGVEAFIAIWKQLDALKWLVPLATRFPLRQILELGYQAFIRVRPYLPRKKCESSTFCEKIP